jgi:hypothetical protein
MNEKILAFKQHVKETSSNPDFLHHKWFVKWHLEVVEKIALELCDHYPEADRDLVEIMVWLHDYGKTLDYAEQYAKTLSAGRQKLTELQFPDAIVEKAIAYIETLDKKLVVDLYSTPIEIQIVSSADGCSHMTGPFMNIFWHEATDATFTGKTYDELMALNLAKVEKDWKYKIVLPEARKAFESRYHFFKELAGELPAKYFS